MGNAHILISLSEFNEEIWPKNNDKCSRITKDEACQRIEAFFEKRGIHLNQKLLAKKVGDASINGMINRRDMINTMVKIKKPSKRLEVDLSTSLFEEGLKGKEHGVEESDKQSETMLSLYYRQLKTDKDVLQLMEGMSDLEELRLNGNDGLVLTNVFYDQVALRFKRLKMIDFSYCKGEKIVPHLSHYISNSPCLQSLCLCGMDVSNHQVLFFEALGRSHLNEVNLESTNISNDLELSLAILQNDTLRSLIISRNPRLGEGSQTLTAVAGSKIEKLVFRKGQRAKSSIYELLLKSKHLYYLDIRETILTGPIVDVFVECLPNNTSLYSLWLGPLLYAYNDQIFKALKENEHLGIMIFVIGDQAWKPASNLLDQESYLLGEKSSLFCVQPSPPANSLLEQQLRENAIDTGKCRTVILLILCSRFYHHEECGPFFGGLQKEIVILITKYVWRTRREACWKNMKK